MRHRKMNLYILKVIFLSFILSPMILSCGQNSSLPGSTRPSFNPGPTPTPDPNPFAPVLERQHFNAQIDFEWYGNEVDGQLGFAVQSTCDTNNDGRPDYIFGGPDQTVNDQSKAGRVYVVSGADGSLLQSLKSSEPSASGQFGYKLGCSDFNGDAWADIIVSEPGSSPQGLEKAGRVWVFSGRDGSVIYDIQGTTAHQRNGLFAQASPDLTGDGVNDILIGSAGSISQGGSAAVYSGSSGEQVWRVVAVGGRHFGLHMLALLDLNRDGVKDVIVSGLSPDNIGYIIGRSGIDGSAIMSIVDGDEPGDLFGQSVHGLGDYNHDGYFDFLVGAPGANAGRGYVRMISGADGSTLFQIDGKVTDGHFGYFVRVVDVNDDGRLDYIVSAPLANTASGIQSGIVRGIDGNTGKKLFEVSGNIDRAFFGTQFVTTDHSHQHFIAGSPFDFNLMFEPTGSVVGFTYQPS